MPLCTLRLAWLVACSAPASALYTHPGGVTYEFAFERATLPAGQALNLVNKTSIPCVVPRRGARCMLVLSVCIPEPEPVLVLHVLECVQPCCVLRAGACWRVLL